MDLAAAKVWRCRKGGDGPCLRTRAPPWLCGAERCQPSMRSVRRPEQCCSAPGARLSACTPRLRQRRSWAPPPPTRTALPALLSLCLGRRPPPLRSSSLLPCAQRLLLCSACGALCPARTAALFTPAAAPFPAPPQAKTEEERDAANAGAAQLAARAKAVREERAADFEKLQVGPVGLGEGAGLVLGRAADRHAAAAGSAGGAHGPGRCGRLQPCTWGRNCAARGAGLAGHSCGTEGNVRNARVDCPAARPRPCRRRGWAPPTRRWSSRRPPLRPRLRGSPPPRSAAWPLALAQAWGAGRCLCAQAPFSHAPSASCFAQLVERSAQRAQQRCPRPPPPPSSPPAGQGGGGARRGQGQRGARAGGV